MCFWPAARDTEEPAKMSPRKQADALATGGRTYLNSRAMYTRKYAAAGYTGESECSILFACTRAMSMVPEASRILFSTQGVRIQNGMTACGTVLNLVPLYSWRLLRRYRSATAEIGRGYRR